MLPCNLYYARILYIDFSHGALGKYRLSEVTVGGAGIANDENCCYILFAHSGVELSIRQYWTHDVRGGGRVGKVLPKRRHSQISEVWKWNTSTKGKTFRQHDWQAFVGIAFRFSILEWRTVFLFLIDDDVSSVSTFYKCIELRL